MNSLALLVALPLLGAFLLPLLGRTLPGLARLIGPATLLLTLWILVRILSGYAGAPLSAAIGGFLPPLGILFYADNISLLLTGAVLLGVLLLWPYERTFEPREGALLLLLTGAANGLAISGDLFNLYVFYELLSVATFGLVAIPKSGAAFAAALRYLILSSFGTILALSGIALLYSQTGTLNLAHLALLTPDLDPRTSLAVFTLLILGFGVKAELFPVNLWVPEVYASTTRRISGLLAGVVSKLSVVVIIRALILLFPQPEAYQLLLALGILGVVSGELAAWRAQDVTRMLAFSSIGQLGAIFIAFSIPGEAGVFAGIALMLHHLLVKPALFLLAQRWGGAIAGLRGGFKASPLGALLFLFLVLSLIGVPPLPGFWAKFLLVTGLASSSIALHQFALLLVLTATVIEATYLFRVVRQLFSDADVEAPAQRHSELDLATITLLVLLLTGGMVFVNPLGKQLDSMAAQVSDTGRYINTVFPSAGGAQ